MAYTQKRYWGPTNAKQSPAPKFKVSDQIDIKGKYFQSTRPSKTLSKKNLGPYPIIAQARTHSFTLQLPDSMKLVHPIFHVFQLEPIVPNTIPIQVQPPLPLVKVDDEPEYEILGTLDSKIDQRRHCNLLYLVQWSSYEGTDDKTSWLLTMELDHASELVWDYHLFDPDKPGPYIPL